MDALTEAKATRDPCIPDEATCGEPGRRMFFEHVGRYFAAAPRLKPLPPGSACTICGSTQARLWLTASGEASCIAQRTITRKRAARTSADEPLTPANDSRGASAMGDGVLIIAGPTVSRIVTKLLPDQPVPDTLEVTFSAPGAVRRTRIDLINEPPPAPFVVITCEKKAGWQTKVTFDTSRISFNGAHACDIDRPYLRRLLAIAERIGTRELLEMIGLRQRLVTRSYKAGMAGDKARKADQEAYRVLRCSNAISATDFRTLPATSAPETTFLRQHAE